jgi:predicted alpha/beta-hydrolase family hydrolase
MDNTEFLPELLTDGSRRAPYTLVLAHGAGAGMDSDFMNTFATGLAEGGLRVVRFEFPYMRMRRRTGKRRPPDREPVLRDAWHAAIKSLDTDKVIVGGKSLGGRIASLIADEIGAVGLICLGYPFHPAGKPEHLRIEHLKTIRTPTFILQGQRDPFGKRDEVAGYKLPNKIQIRWMPDGDHSFKPRKSSGQTQEDNWRAGIEAILDFVRRLSD